jgi:hypothetical protein
LKSSGATDEKVAALLPNGPVVIGFLELNESSGEWDITKEAVSAHVQQLKHQLSECSSVLSWIQTWNSCIGEKNLTLLIVHFLTCRLGRFFGNSFGEAAPIFGRRHVNKILETYVNMQKEVFGSDLHTTSVIKGFLKDRFNTADVPDAFLYFPEELGGLGNCNPFIRLFLVPDRLQESAEIAFRCFEEGELSAWTRQKQRFDDCTKRVKLEKAEKAFSDVKDTPDLDEFMPVE